MITKGDVVASAFEECRISGLTSNPTPKENNQALQLLDDMVLGFQNTGLCIPYNRPSSYGNSDLSDDSGIDENQVLAIKLNLSKMLFSRYGKAVPQRILDDADSLLNSLYTIVLPQRENNQFLPTGAGEYYSYYGEFDQFGYGGYNRYFPQEDNAPNNCTTYDIIVGETNFFYINFNVSPNYLKEYETIDSYTVEDGVRVTVIEDSESDGIVTLKCQGAVTGFGIVKITLTTSESRVYPYDVNFNVTES